LSLSNKIFFVKYNYIFVICFILETSITNFFFVYSIPKKNKYKYVLDMSKEKHGL